MFFKTDQKKSRIDFIWVYLFLLIAFALTQIDFGIHLALFCRSIQTLANGCSLDNYKLIWLLWKQGLLVTLFPALSLSSAVILYLVAPEGFQLPNYIFLYWRGLINLRFGLLIWFYRKNKEKSFCCTDDNPISRNIIKPWGLCTVAFDLFMFWKKNCKEERHRPLRLQLLGWEDTGLNFNINWKRQLPWTGSLLRIFL